MPKINALPAMTTVADDDVFAADDVSTTNKDTKKVTFTKLKEWLQSVASWINSSMVANGFAVQTVSTKYSAYASGTTVLPYDDTIPQSTEGVEFMTQAITPKSATNKLIVEAKLMLGHSAGTDITAALFQDATANALAADANYQGAAGGGITLVLCHEITAGTTSPITFKVRAGGAAAGTTSLNGPNGSRKFGGITCSYIKVTEIKA